MQGLATIRCLRDDFNFLRCFGLVTEMHPCRPGARKSLVGRARGFHSETTTTTPAPHKPRPLYPHPTSTNLTQFVTVAERRRISFCFFFTPWLKNNCFRPSVGPSVCRSVRPLAGSHDAAKLFYIQLQALNLKEQPHHRRGAH